MDPASEPAASVEFGRFRVLPQRRELFTDGRPIKLGARAFDILVALIEARGAVVSKDALMQRVWPDRVAEENNLQTHVVALRKALGAERGLIRTVSGLGYQFTGGIRIPSTSPEKAEAEMATAQPSSVLPPSNVPQPVSALIGREEELSEILNLVTTHRLVTLTGPGGIGKTTLALALARELRPHFANGVWLAEFSALADPGLVPATVAAAVGLELGGGEVSARRVAQALADRRLLLVLDICEHVIAATAAMAEATLGTGSAMHIIATSREPLRAGGEWVYPIQPLAVPAVDLAADDDPLRYGAVLLFLERARAAEPHFAPDRRLMTMIAAICRRLDGIPLAIELAAALAQCSASRRSRPVSTIASVCSPAEGGRPCRGTRRCGRHSTGARSCSPGSARLPSESRRRSSGVNGVSLALAWSNVFPTSRKMRKHSPRCCSRSLQRQH